MSSTTYIDIPYKAGSPKNAHSSAFSYRPRRNLWRLWMRTSRFHRLLIVALILLFFGLLCSSYTRLSAYSILVNSANDVKSANMRTGLQADPVNKLRQIYLNKSRAALSQTGNQAAYSLVMKLDKSFGLPRSVIHSGPAASFTQKSGPLKYPEKPDEEQLPSKSNVEESHKEAGSVQLKREKIRAACRHAWLGYKKFAWGRDHLLPVSQHFEDWFGVGLTIIDGLDTLFIMDLKKEYEEAREFVREDLNFDKNRDVNFFETTIRVLGGLLGAYTITQDELFLQKAKDIGERLLPAFSSRSNIPFSDVNIRTGVAHGPNWAQDSTVSEVSSVQLEFRSLSRYLGDPKFESKAFFVSQHIHKLLEGRAAEGRHHLVPMFISTDTGRFGTEQTITLGARADSYYEYLLKQWIQLGMEDNHFLKRDYIASIESIRDYLVRQSRPNGLLFIGELKSKNFSPKMDHLVCYLPGTLALGYFVGGMPRWHLKLAEDLLYTCTQMYSTTQTGLSPEIAYFNLALNGDNDIIIKSNDAHNLLRPETVESLWYMWYFTRNDTYRTWAWNIFNAFEVFTKVSSGGYTSIGDVQSKLYTRPRDKMESFFLGETLKYLYLIFAPLKDLEKFSPKKFVFNTEAHPLPLYNQ